MLLSIQIGGINDYKKITSPTERLLYPGMHQEISALLQIFINRNANV